MVNRFGIRLVVALLLAGALGAPPVLARGPQQPDPARSVQPDWLADATRALEGELAAKYGEAARPRLQRGLRQVADFWRPADGDRAAFEQFVRTHFAGD